MLSGRSTCADAGRGEFARRSGTKHHARLIAPASGAVRAWLASASRVLSADRSRLKAGHADLATIPRILFPPGYFTEIYYILSKHVHLYTKMTVHLSDIRRCVWEHRVPEP